jgi:hypothetical protein
VFNERDPERRVRAIAANCTEDVICSDPLRTFRGHEALNKRARQLLDNMPDFVFTAAGPVQVLRDLGHLPFNQGVPEQPPAVSGYDVAWSDNVAHIDANANTLSGHGLVSSSVGSREAPLSAYRIRSPSTVRKRTWEIVVVGI